MKEARQRLWKMIEETPSLDWVLWTKRPENFEKLLPKKWLREPRHNVWLVVSEESQLYVERIEEMMCIPAVVHGVSCEPLLEPLTLPEHFLKSPRAWVIAGGESGRQKGVRPAKMEWFRSLRDQTV